MRRIGHKRRRVRPHNTEYRKMAWIDKLQRGIETAERNGALDQWLRSGGPSDLDKSPEEIAIEFCKYMPEWGGKKHRSAIEALIAMYRRAEAQRRANAAPALNGNSLAQTMIDSYRATVDNLERLRRQRTAGAISTDSVEASIDDLLGNNESGRYASDTTDRIDSLAEWIFGCHPTIGTPPWTKKQLEELARTNCVAPGFIKNAFTKAYQKVYETTPARPPKSGWPLREPFRGRLEESKNSPQ
jgi:hypothetical protein